MWFLKIFIRLRRGEKKVLVLKGVSAKYLERFVLATLGRGAGLCGIRVSHRPQWLHDTCT